MKVGDRSLGGFGLVALEPVGPRPAAVRRSRVDAGGEPGLTLRQAGTGVAEIGVGRRAAGQPGATVGPRLPLTMVTRVRWAGLGGRDERVGDACS